MEINNRIEIIEVGPRDGFQSIKEFISTEEKKKIIEGIIESGVKKIQLTSFVSPKHIPQMQDAEEIAKYFLNKYPELEFSALVPNYRGVKRAYEIGLRNIAYVISVSEGHNKANVNRSVDESFVELEKILADFPDINITLDAATTFGCPFDGEVSYDKVDSYVKRAYDLGIRTINLCDTIGISNPKQIDELLTILLEKYKDIEFQVHIHDTRNMGMLNSYIAIKKGIKHVQASLGGMGGCPFAPGASGNLSTEDFVYMLDKINIETGINFKKLVSVAKEYRDNINGVYSGHQINISDKISCNS